MNDLSQNSELMFTSSWNLDDRIISFFILVGWLAYFLSTSLVKI